jgi:hypothetical protein
VRLCSGCGCATAAPLRLIVSVPHVGCSCRRLLPVAYSLTLYLNAAADPWPSLKVVLPRISVGRIGRGGLLWKAAAMCYVNDGKPKTRSRNRRPGFEFGLENVNAVVEMTSPQIKKVGAAMKP